MQQRASNHVAACAVLYSHGYFAPAEALCRTAVEAILNLYYFSLGDTCDLVLQYFKSYICVERKQNKHWATNVERSEYPEEAKQVHRKRIAAKERALSHYERVVTEAFLQINRNYAAVSETFPGIFDRFNAIGKEVSYRTVYAALCSQAHNDAEDLLNDFVHAVMQIRGAREVQAFENENFALYMVLTVVFFLIEAFAMYLAKYFDVLEQFKPLLNDALVEVQEVGKRIPLPEIDHG